MIYISHVQVSKTSNESKLNPLRIRIPSTNYMYIVNLQISDSSIVDIDKENLLVNVTTFKYWVYAIIKVYILIRINNYL